MFGLEARENEARRATEAALELHELVKKIHYTAKPEYKLTMHSGIHSGLVLVIEGDPVFGRYILAGDPPNIAARLSDAAARDEIVVSEFSLGADRSFFETRNDRSIELKGKDQPVNIFSVHGHSNVHTRFEARIRRGITPFVGREKELIVMRTALENCSKNRSQSLSIVASPGIGKTRLVEEFIDQLVDSNCIVLRGYCESYLSAEPLQPVLQILRRLFDWDEPQSTGSAIESASWSMQNNSLSRVHVTILKSLLVPASGSQRPTESEIINAIEKCFEQLSTLQPVVVFIDDWQWADDATPRVLRALSTLNETKLMFITSSRGPIPINPPGESTVIKLQPLKHEYSTQIVRSLIPNSDRFMTHRIEQASGGNALFLEELCHAARVVGKHEQIHLRQNDQREIPIDLKMLIESRIARLSHEQQQVVRVAAIIGNVIPEWLLLEMTGTAKDDPLLTTLAEQDLMFQGETPNTLRFKHGIARDLIADMVGLHERRDWHIKIARALETRYVEGEREDVLEALAYHYGESTEYAKAAEYAESAGDKALTAATLKRARLQYRTALKVITRLDDNYTNYEWWTSIVRKLFMASLHDARREQLEIHQKALQLSISYGDQLGVKNAESRLAYLHYVLGDCREAIQHCKRARVALATEKITPLDVQITATLGQTRAISCQYQKALSDLDEALAMQRPFKANPRIAPTFAYTLGVKGMVLGDQGMFENALLCLDEAHSVVEDPKDPVHASLAAMISGVLLWQGRWDKALKHADRTVELADHMGSSYMSAIGFAMGGYANWKLKKDNTAEQMVRGMSWLDNHDQALWTSILFGWLAETMLETGQYELSKGYAARALQRARKGEHLGDSCTYCVLASLPSDVRNRHTPEYYFKRADAAATVRGSRRERALIQLKEANYLIKAAKINDALERISLCQSEFTDMSMHSYAVQCRALRRQLESTSLVY